MLKKHEVSMISLGAIYLFGLICWALYKANKDKQEVEDIDFNYTDSLEEYKKYDNK